MKFLVAILIAAALLALSCESPRPDGEIIFRKAPDGDTIFMKIPAAGGEPIPLNSPIGPRPDTVKAGEWRVFSEGGRILWVPASGVEPVVVSAKSEISGDPDASAHWGLLTYSAEIASEDARIIIKELPSGRAVRIFDTEKDDIAPSLSPGGDWVAFQSGMGAESRIVLGNIHTGKTLFLTAGESPRWAGRASY